MEQEVLPSKMRAQYQTDILLGAGSSGVVLKAWQTLEGNIRQPVAIKLMYPQTASRFSEDEEKLLQRECLAMSKIHSQFVVSFVDTVTTSSVFGIVMEYLDGVSLEEMIDAHDDDGLPAMSETEALACCKDILEGLYAMHAQGLVHRDIKPGNIICVQATGK